MDDQDAGRILREVVRELVASELERIKASTVSTEETASCGSTQDMASSVSTEAKTTSVSTERPIKPLRGVNPYDLVPHADAVLREEGGPLHVSTIASRIYGLGFRHRWEPKYPNQLQTTVNGLPSRFPKKYERVAPGVLRLRI